jgi:plastocyanin
MANSNIKPGDEVSWKWGKGTATGKVKKVVESKDKIQSKGTKVTRKGDKTNPALEIESSKGAKVLKKASEIDKK